MRQIEQQTPIHYLRSFMAECYAIQVRFEVLCSLLAVLDIDPVWVYRRLSAEETAHPTLQPFFSALVGPRYQEVSLV